MQTLEQRVERLERSCRRWRWGFLMVCVAAAVGAGEVSKPVPPDAEFAHLTVQKLIVRNQPGGALLMLSCDGDQASIQLASPAAMSSVSLIARKDAAHVLVAHDSDTGLPTSANMSADDQSGVIDVRNAGGKNKEIEPE